MKFTDENFNHEVEQYKGVILVDFFASWCGPCKLMAPIIEELIEEYQDQAGVKIGKLDTGENADTAQKYNVMSIPTLILFKDGKEIDQAIGYQSKDFLKQMIDKQISKNKKL